MDLLRQCDWKRRMLIDISSRKICILSNTNFKLVFHRIDYYFLNNILILFVGVLSHLAETLKPVELLALLPSEENPVFVPHLKRCIEKHQADLLKHKIISLGQEIKSMMLY